MPRIVCQTCGREVYTTVPLEQLFAEERRCPRCGAPLEADRRYVDRRTTNRRGSPPGDPGPPDGPERREEERRRERRRRGDGGSVRGSGWLE